MFCPKCGSQLPDDAKFCGNCGAQIQAPAAATSAPGTSSAPGTTPTPNATPNTFASSTSSARVASNNAALLRMAKLIAGAVMLVSFFLPLYGIASLINVSAMQMTFGITIMGSHIDGEFINVLFLAPGILCLVGTLVFKEKQGSILNIIGGLGAILLVFLISNQANAEMGGYISVNFELGAWLYIIAGIVSIVGGVLDLVSSK